MMRARRKIALVSLSIVVAIVVAFFLLDRAPVTVAFVRYERTGTDWYAYMEIHNNSSRPISYHSAGITGTHYVWESPQIQHEGLRVTDVAILPARSNAMFRVLMMTTDHDWRVGIDYDIPLPGWSLRLPMGILDRASRLGIIDSGTHRAWSPQIKKPGPDQSPNEATAPNAAMTLPFQIEHDWRGIGESRRSTNVLTAGMDWPPKGAECAKEIQRIRSRPTSTVRVGPVPFAPLALFRGSPDFPVSLFRARRSSNQTRQAMPVEHHDCIRTRSARHACAPFGEIDNPTA